MSAFFAPCAFHPAEAQKAVAPCLTRRKHESVKSSALDISSTRWSVFVSSICNRRLVTMLHCSSASSLRALHSAVGALVALTLAPRNSVSYRVTVPRKFASSGISRVVFAFGTNVKFRTQAARPLATESISALLPQAAVERERRAREPN